MFKYYKTIDEAIEVVKKTTRIFSEEIGNSSARRYFVCTYEDLFKYLDQLHAQGKAVKIHEFLFGNLPVKLYLDIESSTISKPAFDGMIQEILEFSAAEVKKEFGVTEEPEVYDSSRAEKQSKHIIYPEIVFSNLYELSEFTKRYHKFQIVDQAVYTARKTFRIPYAKSHRSNNTELTCIQNGVAQPYSRERVKRGLVHCIDENVTIHGDSDTHDRKRVKLIQSNEYMEQLKDWAETMGYTLLPPIKEDEHKTLHVILSNVICLSKGEKHKSNRTYLHIKLPKAMTNLSCTSTFTCPDKDCCKFTWPGPNFQRILFLDQTRAAYRGLLED